MIVIGVLQRCQVAFKRHSFVGSVLVYSCLYGGGDIARQTMQRTPKKDYVTTARMAIIGGGCLAPWLYGWYKILDRLLCGKTMHILVKKVIVDQLVASSAGVSIFYVGQSLNQMFFCPFFRHSVGKVATLTRRQCAYTTILMVLWFIASALLYKH